MKQKRAMISGEQREKKQKRLKKDEKKGPMWATCILREKRDVGKKQGEQSE